MVLFQRPVTFESMKPFGYGGAPTGELTVAGLNGLGQFSGILDDILNPLTNVLETVTGAKGQREAQANAIKLAELQAQRDAASGANWVKVAPWIGLGAVVLGAGIVIAVMR